MSDPFIGEIKMNGFNWPPRGYANCDGQSLEIRQNSVLYAIIGNYYGGDNTYFNLPDLKGRTPVHRGYDVLQGFKGGLENVPLTVDQMPAHTHLFKGTTQTGEKPRTGPDRDRSFATCDTADDPLYGNPANLVNMHDGVLPATGGNQAHYNMQPYLVVNFVIALTGTFPPRDR